MNTVDVSEMTIIELFEYVEQDFVEDCFMEALSGIFHRVQRRRQPHLESLSDEDLLDELHTQQPDDYNRDVLEEIERRDARDNSLLGFQEAYRQSGGDLFEFMKIRFLQQL